MFMSGTSYAHAVHIHILCCPCTSNYCCDSLIADTNKGIHEFCTELMHLGKKNPKYEVSFKIMPKIVRTGICSKLSAL